MITNRTLLAYEQFCEEYYDNFDIASRASIVNEENGYAAAPKDGISPERELRLWKAAEYGSRDEKYAKAGFPTRNDFMTVYEISPRVAGKIKMKRDPKYRQWVIDAKEARRQYHSPESIAKRKAMKAANMRIDNAAKKIGNYDK